MNMSFRRPDADGIRYAVSHRCFIVHGLWRVERWDGRDWRRVGDAWSYAEARELATADNQRGERCEA